MFHTLKSKLLMLFLLAVISTSAASFIALVIEQGQYNTLLYSSTSTALDSAAGQFDSTVSNIESVLTLLLKDEIFLDHTREWTGQPDSPVLYDQVFSSLSNYGSSNSYISYICLFSNANMVMYSHYYSVYPRPSEETQRNIYDLVHSTPGEFVWFHPEGDPDGLMLCRMIRELNNYDYEEIGYLAVRVNITRLLQDLSSSQGAYSSYMVLKSSSNNIVFNSSKDDETQLPSNLNDTNYYEIIRYHSKPFFTVSRKLGFWGSTLYNLVDYSRTQRTITWIFLLSVGIVFLTSLLVIAIGWKILNSIVVHFDTLNQKMHIYSSGHLDPPDVGYDYSFRPDELGQAHRHLDQMAGRLKTLINDNYIKQLHIQEAQFKELQYQINPHFLYNTLESINWYAHGVGEEHIPAMVQSLGNILRSSLSANAFLSVKEELQLLSDYMTIQQLRYDDRLKYTVSAPTSVYPYELPKMTLVPLVENAIRYGLDEAVEECIIDVVITDDDDRLILTVRNSGSQFPTESLGDLLQEHSSQGFGIGLNNIDQRIKLSYGEQYGVSVFNRDEMAVVRITLPKHLYKEVKEHAEMPDR